MTPWCDAARNVGHYMPPQRMEVAMSTIEDRNREAIGMAGIGCVDTSLVLVTMVFDGSLAW
jgi:hypothetical protein